MPNWCFNKIAFVSKDKSKVEKIRNIIIEGKKHSKIANDWTDWKVVFRMEWKKYSILELFFLKAKNWIEF